MKNASSCTFQWSENKNWPWTALFFFLFLFPQNSIDAQCYCNGEEIQPPGYNYIDPVYNEYDELVSYHYNFQFSCLGLPMDLFDMYDEYFYHVLYRVAGSSDPWQVSETSVWNDISDYIVTVYGLLPGVEYEFRVNCPCPYPGCDAYTQVENFLNGEPMNNVTRPWTYKLCPGPWINNMEVTNINLVNQTAHISWTYNAKPSGDVQVAYRRKTSPPSDWIVLPDASYPEYILTGLDPCTEYEFKVTVPGVCGVASKTITFKTSDCSVNITNVTDITGTSATVYWGPNGQYPPDNYTISWWVVPAQTFSATTSDLSYTITGLFPNLPYNVRVTPNCNPSAQCSYNSQVWKFKTNCDIYENNNSFAEATPISLDQNYSASISTLTDVDYYAFIPPCERIQVLVDHPLVPTYQDDWFEQLADMPVKIYDENFTEVPMYYFYDDPLQADYGRPFFAVNPGHQHYLVISRKQNINWEIDYRTKCYSMEVRRCMKCYNNESNPIYGNGNVKELPALEEYGLYENPFYYTDVNWSIASGAATIIPTNDPNIVNLSFEQPGTVVLAASVIRCDGAVMTYYMTIQVSDPCYVSGTISSPFVVEGQPLQSYNPMYTSSYTVNLDLPPGTGFSWNIVSGQALWSVNGNSINIFQSSADVVFQFDFLEGECAGKSRTYRFSLVGFTGNPTDEFKVNPNPIKNVLRIIPPIKNNSSATGFTVELLNVYSLKVAGVQGNFSEQLRLDCSDLPAGNYFVRITCDGYLQTFPVTKI
ncbi:MAG: hypothetical protein DYG98_12050 [Haliscomenobacteraceae bacterium CHB4]|nr:hypothetical protein [Haliscomenobacteraceae bacterium CHB4]